MTWPDDMAAEMPPARPDEPGSLRQEILDELHDHLQSSLEYERLCGRDDDEARESVLSRFGNPVTIARQLWWDNMRGRIMAQRITLVFLALLCACSIFATFVMWDSIQKSQQVTVALVEEIRKLSEREPVAVVTPAHDERVQYLDWIPVSVKLVDKDGKPISDPKVNVRLSGNLLRDGENASTSIDEHPDENGAIDFGFVKPGHMYVNVTMPWGESDNRHQLARPGSPVELTIVCPREEVAYVPTKVSVDWPAPFKEELVWTHLELQTIDRYVDGTHWNGKFESSVPRKYGSSRVNEYDQLYLQSIPPDELQTSLATMSELESRRINLSLLIGPDGSLYRTPLWIATILEAEQRDAKEGDNSSDGGGRSRRSPPPVARSGFDYELLGGYAGGPGMSSPRADALGRIVYLTMEHWRRSMNLVPLEAQSFEGVATNEKNRKPVLDWPEFDRVILAASLSHPLKAVSLPTNGVAIQAVNVMRVRKVPDVDDPTFQTILPVFLSREVKALLHKENEAGELVYRPDADLVELVDERLTFLKSKFAKSEKTATE